MFGEVCDAEKMQDARTSLRTARGAMLDEHHARELLMAAGFTLVHTGVEERALFFSSGRAVVEDPLVRDILLPSWVNADVPALSRVRGAAASAIDTSYGSSRFTVRVRTGILTARASSPRATTQA